MSEQQLITLEWIESQKTAAGGWKRKTVERMGGTWPLVSGWKYRLIGKLIPIPKGPTPPRQDNDEELSVMAKSKLGGMGLLLLETEPVSDLQAVAVALRYYSSGIKQVSKKTASRELVKRFLRGELHLKREWEAVVTAKKEKRKPRPRQSDKEFYYGNGWRELRYRVLKKYGATCMVCNRDRTHGIVIHVDHIKPRSKFPELELDESNLQVLCEDCNLGKSNRDEIDWRPTVY